MMERHYMDTEPYWDGMRRQRLVLQYCLDSGRFQHFPRPISIYTGTRNLGWREVGGRGLLQAWTLNRHMTVQHDHTAAPLTVIVDLLENVRILGWLTPPEDPNALRAGLGVEISWREQAGPSLVPTFRLTT